MLHAHDPARFPEHDLDLARITVEAAGPVEGLGPGHHCLEVDQCALGLRHDLLGDHEHVVILERQRAGRGREGVCQDARQVVADPDLGHALEGDHLDPDGPARLPAVGSSGIPRLGVGAGGWSGRHRIR